MNSLTQICSGVPENGTPEPNFLISRPQRTQYQHNGAANFTAGRHWCIVCLWEIAKKIGQALWRAEIKSEKSNCIVYRGEWQRPGFWLDRIPAELEPLSIVPSRAKLVYLTPIKSDPEENPTARTTKLKFPKTDNPQ